MGSFNVLREFFSRENQCLGTTAKAVAVCICVAVGVIITGLIGWGIDNALFHLITPDDMLRPLLFFFVGLADVCMMIIVVAIPTGLIVGITFVCRSVYEECKLAKKRSENVLII